jgi:hypothetical protein
MSVRGLQPQTFTIPLAAGLATKEDPRALTPPGLTVCKDAQFDELGGIQTRYPYAVTSTAIYGGGTIAEPRRLVENGDELLLFTETALYSWNAEAEAWVSRGTHLAAKVAEETKFATTTDQVHADRCELSGVVFHAWEDGQQCWLAATDKTTGAVLYGPATVTGDIRPRLVALSTRVLLFTVTGDPELIVYSLDPADPGAGITAGAATVVPVANMSATGNYDVTRLLTTDTAVGAAQLSPTTSYRLFTVTAAGVVTSSTKARECDGVAVSSHPAGTHVQVARVDSTSIVGDYVAISGMADVYTAQAIGSMAGSPSHVTAAHRSVADSGQFRCYVFWSDGSTMESNWVDTGGTLGSETTFVRLLDCASRAFDHDGRVYLWTLFDNESLFFSGGFAPQFNYELQQTYFLYRDDAFLVAKATAGKAGDQTANGWLPGVQNVAGSTYTFAGTERRVINIGGSGRRRRKYGAHAPRDIAVTFDSNEARRCVRLGQTLYVTGGEILQYDGASLTEVGFHVYPHTLVISQTGAAGLPNGTYAYKQTPRWDNARGEVDRSTTATVGAFEVTGGPRQVRVDWTPIYTTHKAGIAMETWRTAVNPTEDAPFYLVTSKNPADTANPNRYLQNTSAASGDQLQDELEDADITELETSQENGGILENLAPPAATIIAASADRIFLAGLAGDPYRVAYSKLRGEGEVASFHDGLTVAVPPSGGPITALAFLNETLIVFKETAIYALAGDGLDNLGGGTNYGPARLLAADVGAVSAEAVAHTPMGLLFKSSKGWYLLNRGWSVEYVGGPVAEFDADTVAAVHVVETQHQVRCLTTSRMLVWDYLAQQWAEWTVTDGIHAAMWNGTHHYLAATGPKAQLTTYTGLDYGLDVETAWIPLGSPGWGRVWKLVVLGEYRSAHRLRIRVGKNYATTFFQDKYWTVSPTDVGEPEQVKHGPSIQEMEAIRVRLTAVATATSDPPTGEALKLTRLSLELGLERGVRPLTAAQVQ